MILASKTNNSVKIVAKLKKSSQNLWESAISKCFKTAGYIQKQGNEIPYELNPKDDFTAETPKKAITFA